MLINEVVLGMEHDIKITNKDPENTMGSITTYGGKIDFVANSNGLINEEIEELARFNNEFYIENAENRAVPGNGSSGLLHKTIAVAINYASEQGYQVITYGTIDERYGEESINLESYFRNEGFKYVPNNSNIMFKDLTETPGSNTYRQSKEIPRHEIITRIEKALKEAKATDNRFVNIEFFGRRFKISPEEIIEQLEDALSIVKDKNNNSAQFRIAYEDFSFDFS